MNTTRALLGMLGGLAAGYAIISLLYLTPLDFGVGLAISAACIVGIGLIRYVQRSSRRAMRAQRDAVWERRDGGWRVEFRDGYPYRIGGRR